MKKFTLVSIVALIVLLSIPAHLFAKDEDWVDQAIEDIKCNNNVRLATQIVENNKGDFEIAQRFMDAQKFVDLRCGDLAIIVLKRYRYEDNPENVARAWFNIGKVELIQRKHKSAINSFNEVISREDSYREEIITIIRNIVIANILYPNMSISDDRIISDIHITKFLIESINSFGGKIDNDKFYAMAMNSVPSDFSNNNVSSAKEYAIVYLGTALLFADTQEKKNCIGNKHLEIALQCEDTKHYKMAKEILGKDVVLAARKNNYGIMATK